VRRLVCALSIVTVVTMLSACSTGTDSVARRTDFQFIAPGGQAKIFYDPPETRGVISPIEGEILTEPGKRISTADFQGDVVVLNIWGAWCGPCRAEMPDFQRVHDKTKDDGVRLLGVDVRDEVRSAPEDFIRNLGITYPSIYDPPGRSLLALKGYPRNVVPSTIILDRQHRVAAIYLTALTESELLPVVQRLAAEQRHEPTVRPTG
jgi:thiol-disulfide isomerase/thioredoxin